MANLVFAGAGHVFPTTVRRFNMLRPFRWEYRTEDALPGAIRMMDWDNADYFKDWLPYNTLASGGSTPPGTDTITFGAFTTAPDGTTDTARLIVESTDNTEHSVLSGIGYQGVFHYGRLRFAGVFKHAGRRIKMTIQISPGIGLIGPPTEMPIAYGSKAIFDLENGQVGVAHTAFTGPFVPLARPWTLSPAYIEEISDGWYLCYIEAIINTTQPEYSSNSVTLYCKVSLDNGTGTAAESSAYTGDGTSGVYAWRGNMLPSRAWNMRRTAFFDDFDTMDTIDIDNTMAEGYNWYIRSMFPAYDVNFTEVLTSRDHVTVADSVMTCDTHPYMLFMGTVASTWVKPPPAQVDRAYTDGYVGNKGYVIPAIFECRAKYPLSSHATMWTVSWEWLTYGGVVDPAGEQVGREIDYFETLFTNYLPQNTVLYIEPGLPGTVAVNLTHVSNIPRPIIDTWSPLVGYQAGVHADYLGTAYTAVLGNTNKPPNVNPTEWGPYQFAADTVSVLPPTTQTHEFNDYAVMCFPWTPEEPGQMYNFFNGGFCYAGLVYAPDLAGGPGIVPERLLYHLSDGLHYPILLGTMGLGSSWDWVRVMQNG